MMSSVAVWRSFQMRSDSDDQSKPGTEAISAVRLTPGGPSHRNPGGDAGSNLVSFACLKSFVCDQLLRGFERKDAHGADLLHRVTRQRGMDAVAEAFRNERGAKHVAVIEASLAIRRNRLADTIGSRAYRNGSRASVAKFELGEGDEPEQREARAWRVMPSQHFCRTGRRYCEQRIIGSPTESAA
jgi:hypothetical protein